MLQSIPEIKYLEFNYPEVPDLISIVICVKNSAKYLERMLDSIFAQTYENFEVIVAYDTKSSDNSLDILKRYGEKNRLIIDFGDDCSIGVARARGARLARGEYFIYLDSDDVIIPTFLEDLLGCFVRFPEIDVAYCGYRRATESTVMKRYRECQKSNNTYSLLDTDDALHYFRDGSFDGSVCHFSIMGPVWVWLVRRHFLEKICCFFPDVAVCEDNAYVIQLIINSKKIGHSSRLGYVYVYYSGSLCHKQKSGDQIKAEFNQQYSILTPLLTSAGYGEFISQQKEGDLRKYLPSVMVASLRTLPYLEFKSALKNENIKKLYVSGSLLEKLNCICFNVSKWLYWKIHQIRSRS